jgi:NAD(P)-dependent dehydrogenase (short-subunit alcohol dehydrogenase family)
MARTHAKVVLVTGCSSGIGRAAMVMLLERGHTVYAGARRTESVDALADEFARFGGRVRPMRVDLTDGNTFDAVAKELVGATDGIDALVNNAGYGKIGAVEDLTSQDLRDQYETNVIGTMELTRRVLPMMRERRTGRVVNVSSVVAHVSTPLMGAYNSSKAALNALSESLRMELAGSGIDVVMIEPGVIKTDFRANADKHWPGVEALRDSPYYESYSSWWATWQARLAGSMTGPSAVARVIVRAIESRRPKTRYKVTLAAHIAPLIWSVLPDRVSDRIVCRGFGLPAKG